MLSLLGPTTGSALYVITGVVVIIVVLMIIVIIVMVLLVVTKRTAKKRIVYFNSGNDIMTRLIMLYCTHRTCCLSPTTSRY